MKRKQQVLSNLAKLIGKAFGLLLLFICFGCMSQNNYRVESIYSVPNTGFVLIRVTDLESQEGLTILSERKLHKINQVDTLTVGKAVHLELSLLVSSPLKSLLPANTRGSQVLYIDGTKVYDPEEKLYSSDCLNGTYLKTNCE